MVRRRIPAFLSTFVLLLGLFSSARLYRCSMSKTLSAKAHHCCPKTPAQPQVSGSTSCCDSWEAPGDQPVGQLQPELPGLTLSVAAAPTLELWSPRAHRSPPLQRARDPPISGPLFRLHCQFLI